MNLLVSRKWRQFFKRIPLRTSFTIVLILVLSNLIVYFLWNHYQQRATDQVAGTVERQLETENHSIDEFDNGTDASIYYQHRYSDAANGSAAPCPERPQALVGRFVPDLIVYHWHVIESKNPHVSQGHWAPTECRSAQRVAIIVPYRNRDKHIKVLVNNLHAFLQKQQRDYGIFVVEQMSGTSFNRAMLFNIGYKESSKWNDFNCFVFHDVDLIPENDNNLYQCGSNPRHLSAYIDKFSYKLPYQDLFGGVCAISIQQFQKVNGFSNFYFGWGGEDDDMSKRLRHYGYQIYRYPSMIGAYKMIKHNGDSGNAANTWRFALVKSAVMRIQKDGLNSLQYTLVSSVAQKLTVWLQVQVEEEKMKLNYSIWIKQNFFDADLNYQLKVVVVVLMIFIGSLVIMCFIVMCAIKVTPDSYQPLLSNKILILEKSRPPSR